MRVVVEQPSSVAFTAKHWTKGPIGWGGGEEMLRSSSRLVTEFAYDRSVPKDLRFAAASVWLAVENAHVASLCGDGRGFGARKRFDISEDGWKVGLIRDGIDFGNEPTNNLGILLRRTGYDEPAGWGYSELRGRPIPDPRTAYSDSYVWVAPKHRGEGVATAALESLGGGVDLRMPFEIDATNIAATKLVEHFVQTEPVAVAQ